MTDTLLWYTTRGAGAVTLVLLSGSVVLGILSVLRVQSAAWPRFLTTGLHRNLALMTLVFLALHVVTAVVDPFTHLGWLAAIVPFSSYYRTLWLRLRTIAFRLPAAIVLPRILRRFLGPSGRACVPLAGLRVMAGRGRSRVRHWNRLVVGLVHRSQRSLRCGCGGRNR